MIKMITYPLNNIDYTAEDAELYFSTRESGVYDGNDFEVTVSGIDNDVIVGIGTAWIHNTKFSGKVTALKEPKTLTLSLPNSVYDRIDAIVIQFDANKNATEIVVKEGIASSSPIAPNVVRTESLYELHIYHVLRKAGATVIDVDDLVDLRNDQSYCGIMFDPISSIDTTLKKSGYAADAKATGEAIKRATTVLNLLVNSDFTNPVNQRGATSYTVNGYTIDRWKIWNATSGNGTVTLNSDGGITITAKSGKATFSQFFEEGVLDANKSYTFAYMTTDGLNIENDAVRTLTSGSAAGTKYVEISVETSSVTVLWAALYEGTYTAETLPPYVPKVYGAELLECQRYYYEIKAASTGILVGIAKKHSNTAATVMIVLPTVLRAKYPTASKAGTVIIESNDTPVTGVVSAEVRGLVLNVRVNCDMSSLSYGTSYPVTIEKDSIIRVSADL